MLLWQCAIVRYVQSIAVCPGTRGDMSCCRGGTYRLQLILVLQEPCVHCPCNTSEMSSFCNTRTPPLHPSRVVFLVPFGTILVHVLIIHSATHFTTIKPVLALIS